MEPLLYGMIILFFSGSVLAFEPSEALLKTTYCACLCCEKNPAKCFRHASIPDTFKCSESMCSEKFCDVWDKASCGKQCFCKQCKHELPDKDYRCISFTSLPSNCKCDEVIDCSLAVKQGQSEAVKKGFDKFSGKASKLECVLPCFCNQCKEKVPPAIYGDCLKSEEPPEDCECGKMSCPSEELLKALKKLDENRAEREKSDTEYTFSEEIDQAMSPEKAKATKCKMQCYCDACSASDDQIKSSCERMRPTPRMEDCKCNPENIKCPHDDVDKICKIFCFCKGCMTDERMTPEMVKSCETLIKKKHDCLCEEKVKCGSLKNIPNAADVLTKDKKAKKGKLKPKKKDRDEL